MPGQALDHREGEPVDHTGDEDDRHVFNLGPPDGDRLVPGREDPDVAEQPDSADDGQQPKSDADAGGQGRGNGPLADAFRAFEALWAPGQMVSLPYVWDPNDRSWEDTDWGPGFEPYGVGSSMQEGFGERVLGRAAPTPA